MDQQAESLDYVNNSIGAESIQVGIMHFLSGVSKSRETLVKEVTLMAIAEINQSGGILGKTIEPIVLDIAEPKSNISAQTRHLLVDLGLKHLFGLSASTLRKKVIPILEKHQAQLWYPYACEGLELSKNVFYMGACPNQVVQPAINWLLQHKGKRLFLIGTDGTYSRTLSKIIRAQIKQQNGFLIFEEYIPVDQFDYQECISKIKHIAPDAVISTLTPEHSSSFLCAYAAAGLRANNQPVLSMRLSDVELQQISQQICDHEQDGLEMSSLSGHLASANYFHCLDNPQNQDFLRKANIWFGYDPESQSLATNAAMQTAYTQIFFWKQAVEAAQSFDVVAIREAAYNQSYAAPAGEIICDRNHYIWTACHIAEITSIGKLEIIHTIAPIQPLPWLGAEELNLNNSNIMIEMLAEIAQGIQQSWQLENDTQELESQIAQLLGRGQGKGRNQLAPEITRAAMSKMFKANQRLLKAQADLLGVEGALREANDLLEQRIEQRTVQLQKTIKRLQNEASERQQAESQLRESQQRFSAIADNVPGVVYRAVLHPDGAVSMPYISPSTQVIFGISVNDFNEHLEWVFDMAHPEDRAELNEMVRISAEELTYFEHEYRVSSLFEKVKWVRIISQPHRNQEGDTVWDGVIIDISHQKSIEESLRAEQEKSENLLLNMLPQEIVRQLKSSSNTIASRADNVTILFADIVDFTALATRISPNELVNVLNQIFSSFDMLADQLGLEKIKTIGDAYMVVGGLPTAREDHAEAIAEMAIAMQRVVTQFKRDDNESFRLRIGINTGSVVAGVIGIRKFIYDLWGDAVNIASRMESQGLAGGIQVTETTYELLKEKYSFWHRGKVFIKGRGEMDTYMLLDNISSLQIPNKAELEVVTTNNIVLRA
jgi:PAS domain S-box-containing protein